MSQVVGEGQRKVVRPSLSESDCRRPDGCHATVNVIGADRRASQWPRDQVVDSADGGSELFGSARIRGLGVGARPLSGRRRVSPVRVGGPALTGLEIVEEDRRRAAAAAAAGADGPIYVQSPSCDGPAGERTDLVDVVHAITLQIG